MTVLQSEVTWDTGPHKTSEDSDTRRERNTTRLPVSRDGGGVGFVNDSCPLCDGFADVNTTENTTPYNRKKAHCIIGALG